MENLLWLIWKEPSSRRRYIIGELSYDSKIYKFKYLNDEILEAQEHGFHNFPGFNELKKCYKSEELFSNIDSRLPNLNRPDYLEILNFYDLDSTSTKMEILKRTKGRLLTDNFEFVPVFNSQKLEFEVAGTRHSESYDKIKKLLSINDTLYLKKDLDNKYDENAIKIISKTPNEEYCLGYVPRYYTKKLSELLDRNVKYSAKIKYLKFESLLSDEYITVEVKLIFEEII